ncbi:UPF0472 protein C16orf72 homolog isoform X1 [Aphidius gifuensis]|uniref:UPF0472 protein C16orf72 homolog isoform X1 n=1 Tax=Aphidius gifuensis TaxID=684658 RepID=UPI001CDC6320|nr:UPF0472 protein C16orf72 homolog isoform X1 [Aphidius gifuensis]
MSEDREEDSLMDFWYTSWEQQCVAAIEEQPDYETQLHNQKEIFTQEIWSGFQTTASAIAQLYKDRSQGASSLWVPFQTAAGTVTSLYKGSIDGVRRFTDLGTEVGKQKRSKELMNWARKKRRMIRREDLLEYLAGKSPPRSINQSNINNCRSSPRTRMMVCGSPSSQNQASSMVVSPPAVPDDPDANLHAFREAIALSNSPISRRNGKPSELSSFISNEFARHHKRPASHDVDMGSPTHKRSRFM